MVTQTVTGKGAVGISLTAGPGPIKIDKLPVRVAIVGSRSFQDKARVREVIVGLRELYGIDGVQFVTGDCPTGVDAFVRELLQGRCTVHYANWNLHGESAGPRRNTEVVRDCSELIALVDGRLEESRGTADTVKKARRAGKKVTVWEVE